MKAEKILTGLVICSLLGMAGCSKDKEEGNYFLYGGVEYPLNQGVIQFYGQLSEGAGYNFDVSLFSSGITFDEVEADLDGTGQAIYFEMFSSSATGLANGDYLFDMLASENALTFDKGNFGTNLDFNAQTGEVINIISGKVTVSKSGNEYEFSFSGEIQGGATVTGHYKGSIPYYDWSAGKK